MENMGNENFSPERKSDINKLNRSFEKLKDIIRKYDLVCQSNFQESDFKIIGGCYDGETDI